MGRDYLAQYVGGGCADLGCNAYKVLLRMALAVYDHETEGVPEGIYWGGWRGLTPALGYGVVREYDPMPPNAEKAIGRAIAELIAKGYISKAPHGIQREYRNRVYRLDPTVVFRGNKLAPIRSPGPVDKPGDNPVE